MDARSQRWPLPGWLGAVIKEFLVHYHQARPHQGLEQRCPEPLVLAPSGCLSAVRSSATIALGGVTPRVLPSRVIELTHAGVRHRSIDASANVTPEEPHPFRMDFSLRLVSYRGPASGRRPGAALFFWI
jgi:hypothetical protein